MSAVRVIIPPMHGIIDVGTPEADAFFNSVPDNPPPPPTPSPAIARLLAFQEMAANGLVFDDADGVRHEISSSFTSVSPDGEAVRVFSTSFYTDADGPTARLAYIAGHFYEIINTDESTAVPNTTLVPLVVKHGDTYHNISVIGMEAEDLVLSVRNDFTAPKMLRMPDERNIIPFARDLFDYPDTTA
jgi:hypothetical protein